MPRAGKTEVQSADGSHKGKQPRKADKKDEWAGFVPCELDADNREAFDVWYGGDDTAVRRVLDDALGSGLKFTVTYDGGNQCYVASLSGRPDVGGTIAFTAILTGRAGRFLEACAVVCYKHVEVLRLEWWDALNKPKRDKRTFG